MTHEQFGKLLRAWFKAKNITRAHVSKSSGLSKPMLTYYYRGEAIPSLSKAILIAKILGVGMDEFIKGPKSKNPSEEGPARKAGLRDN